MTKRTRVEILTLEELAVALGKKYGTVRNNLAEMIKNGEELAFGKYHLFGQPNRNWYAYDSEKYEIKLIGAVTQTGKPTHKSLSHPMDNQEHPANEPEQ